MSGNNQRKSYFIQDTELKNSDQDFFRHEDVANNLKRVIKENEAPQLMKEYGILTSKIEKTNEVYALAKISGLKYCEFLNPQYGTDYFSVI